MIKSNDFEALPHRYNISSISAIHKSMRREMMEILSRLIFYVLSNPFAIASLDLSKFNQNESSELYQDLVKCNSISRTEEKVAGFFEIFFNYLDKNISQIGLRQLRVLQKIIQKIPYQINPDFFERVEDLVIKHENEEKLEKESLSLLQKFIKTMIARKLTIQIVGYPNNKSYEYSKILKEKSTETDWIFKIGNKVAMSKSSFKIPFEGIELSFSCVNKEIFFVQSECEKIDDFCYIETIDEVVESGMIFYIDDYKFMIEEENNSSVLIFVTTFDDALIGQMRFNETKIIGHSSDDGGLPFSRLRENQLEVVKYGERWHLKNNQPSIKLYVALHNRAKFSSDSRILHINRDCSLLVKNIEFKLLFTLVE
jgi:hypothetical protein